MQIQLHNIHFRQQLFGCLSLNMLAVAIYITLINKCTCKRYVVRANSYIRLSFCTLPLLLNNEVCFPRCTDVAANILESLSRLCRSPYKPYYCHELNAFTSYSKRKHKHTFKFEYLKALKLYLLDVEIN